MEHSNPKKNGLDDHDVAKMANRWRQKFTGGEILLKIDNIRGVRVSHPIGSVTQRTEREGSQAVV